ncbi:MAG: hypothetical protein GQ574_03620 [Crocinitomix sp.]|nr:hypothetical protein [Crocinitomix sp.]
MNKLILPIISAILLGACSGAPAANENIEMVAIDTTIEQETETQLNEDTLDTLVIPDELAEIVELTDLNDNAALADYIDYMKEAMENVTNPVRVKYVGCDFGDYFHLSFTGANDLYLDFGDGNNDFGAYQLYDHLTFEDNPAYLDKTFDLYWEFKASSFYCCEGEMENVTAIIPSIVKLELIQD